jgi:small conductance mechanosensitive channel
MELWNQIMEQFGAAAVGNQTLASDLDQLVSTQVSTQPLWVTIAIRAGLLLLLVLVARWLASVGRRWLNRILVKTTLTPTMIGLFDRLFFFALLAGVILGGLALFGVPITGIVAALGAVGLVLGIALQESIGNFAATVVFLLFEPFKVGELIETGDVLGVVTEIQPFDTVITKYDKKIVTLPNGRIQSNGVINYSRAGILRADQLFTIRHEDDLQRALAILQEIVAADQRILADPAPVINIRAVDGSGVTLAVLPMVKFDDYWPVQADLRFAVKQRFDQEGIVIPYPQRTLHLPAEIEWPAGAQRELITATESASGGNPNTPPV